MSVDPQRPSSPPQAESPPEVALPPPPVDRPADTASTAQGAAPTEPGESSKPPDESEAESARQRIKIGTQRAGVTAPKLEPRTQIAYRTPPQQPPDDEESQPTPTIQRKPGPTKSKFDIATPTSGKVELPNLRQALSPDLEAELQEALGDATLDELIAAETAGPARPEGLEPESRHKARVLRVFRDNVFVDLGGRNQGVLPLHQLPHEPEVDAELDVVVTKFNVEDGLYELTLSGASVDVGDWSDLAEGITVDARITGHNKGGLECEVNKIRGFIPAGQISLYRVENFEEFVGQAWPCVVVEANRDRRNLVLSRRAVLEREQAEAKKQLLEQLQVGDVREGTVRSIRDFGAFVDLGGVDGLIHVSQMSWDRIKHPSEVLEVGQRVKVRINKIDPDTHKISLAYRDLFESPWVSAATKYPVTSKIKGKVSKIMDFGAFVKLEPGVEGLVHISELSHKRVFRVSDVVQEGQEIEAKVLSVDPENQRISLSMKALEARPEPPKKPDGPPDPESEDSLPPPRRPERKQPLQGGLGRSPLGEKFGLKW